MKHENGYSDVGVHDRNKIDALAQIVTSEGLSVAEKAKKAADVISGQYTSDIALCGRMLEPDTKDKNTDKVKWENTNVEAALQVSHAISTHIARPEIDYYVAADDEPGDDRCWIHRRGDVCFGLFLQYYQLLEYLDNQPPG